MLKMQSMRLISTIKLKNKMDKILLFLMEFGNVLEIKIIQMITLKIFQNLTKDLAITRVKYFFYSNNCKGILQISYTLRKLSLIKISTKKS